MKYYLKERPPLKKNLKNAANKARADVEKICLDEGYQRMDLIIPYSDTGNFIKIIGDQIQNAHLWKKCLSTLKERDILFIQFPVKTHSIVLGNLLRKTIRKNRYIVLLIHDLDLLRFNNSRNISLLKKIRMFFEDRMVLREASFIISHNQKMTDYLKSISIPEEKIINLGLFDYLLDSSVPYIESEPDNTVIIAGNLNPEKVGYLHEIHTIKGCQFHLYGEGFLQELPQNVQYFGSFMPDELPAYLQGSFGLVWDGSSVNCCEGIAGDYLRYNNPHKTSLYIAAGIPVVVWKESALAEFVQLYSVGITVSSLDDMQQKILSMSEEEYFEYKRNTERLAQKLRCGGFLAEALTEMEEKVCRDMAVLK